ARHRDRLALRDQRRWRSARRCRPTQFVSATATVFAATRCGESGGRSNAVQPRRGAWRRIVL
ncbi:MAG: hypothetical protein AVDCRST_MAG42-2941, partial [uncultured Chthoniobacterales bacterium]